LDDEWLISRVVDPKGVEAGISAFEAGFRPPHFSWNTRQVNKPPSIVMNRRLHPWRRSSSRDALTLDVKKAGSTPPGSATIAMFGLTLDVKKARSTPPLAGNALICLGSIHDRRP